MLCLLLARALREGQGARAGLGGGRSHSRPQAGRIGGHDRDDRSSLRAGAAGPSRRSPSRRCREAAPCPRCLAGRCDRTRPSAACGACSSPGSSARRCHRRDHQPSTHRARRMAGHRTRCVEPVAPRHRDRWLLAPFASGRTADRGSRGVGHRSGRRPTGRHVVAPKGANASAHSPGPSPCTACESRARTHLSRQRLDGHPAQPRRFQTLRRPTRSAALSSVRRPPPQGACSSSRA
jgi:hypothetical protein